MTDEQTPDDVREAVARAFSKFRDGMVPYPYDYGDGYEARRPR